MRGIRLGKRTVRIVVIGALGLGVAGAVGITTWASADEAPAPAPSVTVETPSSPAQTPSGQTSEEQMDSDAAVWS